MQKVVYVGWMTGYQVTGLGHVGYVSVETIETDTNIIPFREGMAETGPV